MPKIVSNKTEFILDSYKTILVVHKVVGFMRGIKLTKIRIYDEFQETNKYKQMTLTFD